MLFLGCFKLVNFIFWLLLHMWDRDFHFFYHILTSSVTYYWTDARQLGIYLLNRAWQRHCCSLWKWSLFWKLKVMLGSLHSARALKKWGETRDGVECFSLHFFRALAASCVLYNRTEHSQGFSICRWIIVNWIAMTPREINCISPFLWSQSTICWKSVRWEQPVKKYLVLKNICVIKISITFSLY